MRRQGVWIGVILVLALASLTMRRAGVEVDTTASETAPAPAAVEVADAEPDASRELDDVVSGDVESVALGEESGASAVAIEALDRAAPAPPPATALSAEEEAALARLSTTERATVTQGLALLAELRALPGAAPLVDDVVRYLKTADEAAFSTGNLPRAENGLAVVDERASEHMIKDPVIRAKWDELMAIVAEHAGRP